METENVWDYPRPPRLERVSDRLSVVFGGDVIATTTAGYRVLETSHAPTYYLPPDAIAAGALVANPRQSHCEWKGLASYFDVVRGDHTAPAAAWCYAEPSAGFTAIAGYLAFYAEPMDACHVGGTKVTPQPGNFYGGWATPNLVGPIKGAPGTRHW